MTSAEVLKLLDETLTELGAIDLSNNIKVEEDEKHEKESPLAALAPYYKPVYGHADHAGSHDDSQPQVFTVQSADPDDAPIRVARVLQKSSIVGSAGGEAAPVQQLVDEVLAHTVVSPNVQRLVAPLFHTEKHVFMILERVSGSIVEPLPVSDALNKKAKANGFPPSSIVAGNLAALIRSKGRLPEPVTRLVAHGLLSGLSDLHRAGFCHRAVTPEAVLVAMHWQAAPTSSECPSGSSSSADKITLIETLDVKLTHFQNVQHSCEIKLGVNATPRDYIGAVKAAIDRSNVLAESSDNRSSDKKRRNDAAGDSDAEDDLDDQECYASASAPAARIRTRAAGSFLFWPPEVLSATLMSMECSGPSAAVAEWRTTFIALTKSDTWAAGLCILNCVEGRAMVVDPAFLRAASDEMTQMQALQELIEKNGHLDNIKFASPDAREFITLLLCTDVLYRPTPAEALVEHRRREKQKLVRHESWVSRAAVGKSVLVVTASFDGEGSGGESEMMKVSCELM